MLKVLTQKPLWILSALILLGAFLVSTGFFSIDEAIYYLGARAIAEHGSFAIDNGYAQFHSEALKLRFLVDGPHGLTPQYPAGTALLGGLLLPLLGPRAFILMNALAGIAMLFTIRRICVDQFKSEAVARIAVALLVAGTFWLEFALGLWPHVLSAYFALQAYWYALQHLGAEEADQKEYRTVVLSGLFAATGMLFRIDAFLAVPAIGLMLALFAPRAAHSLTWFGVGTLPPLALMSGLNYLKFGSLNPLSYGQSGGNTDLSAYGVIFAALCVAFGILFIIRRAEWKFNGRAAIASCVAIGIAVVLVPSANAQLLRCWNGFIALVVDVRSVDDHRLGVLPGAGGTLIFFGLAKKALGQSMPWIGVTAILLTERLHQSERRAIVTLLLFILTFALPFILLSWHGGGGSNMRYFLPILPALSIIGAKLAYDLWRSVSNAPAFIAIGVWAVEGLAIAWYFLSPSGFGGVQQILSTYLLLATALAAVAAGIGWRLQPIARGVTIALFSGGFLMSMSFAFYDFRVAESWRAKSLAVNEAVATLPSRSLVIARPEWSTAWLPSNGSFAAARDHATEQLDQQLIVKAHDAGYRVFVASPEFEAKRDVPPGLQAVATNHKFTGGRMIELRRVGGLKQPSSPASLQSAQLSNP